MQNGRIAEKNDKLDRRAFHRAAGRSVAGIVSFSLGLASSTVTAAGKPANELVVLPVPRTIPHFSFHDGQGQKLSLEHFHGKLVVFNLWASWCRPCVNELPSLDRLHKALAPRGGMVLALSQDRGGLSAVAPFLAQKRLELAAYIDPTNAAQKALSTNALPTTAIVAPNGLEVARLIGGAEWDRPQTIQQLELWLPSPLIAL